MKYIYLVWNFTVYGDGFICQGGYKTKKSAEKAYKALMKAEYGTTNEDKLLDIWNDTGDSWRITKIPMKD